ncbi:hypothetical protein [Cohnella sp. GCM10012308]|uniref:hypothetical protein n=1 Tax=Cohnella sp. GCM10012308 TaxID=3317329 RepID=UPI00361FFDC8
MSKMLKGSISFLMVFLMILALGSVVPAFAATHTRAYQFLYDEEYDEHTSGFIAGDAVIDDTVGSVTLKLQGGQYFPQIRVGSTFYNGSYNSTTGLTTFILPGSDAASLELSLHVVVNSGPILIEDTWYDLEVEWLGTFVDTQAPSAPTQLMLTGQSSITAGLS